MEIKKILWPTDFSKNAEATLPFIFSLIEQYQAEIHVMYVVEDLSFYNTWLGGDAPRKVEEMAHMTAGAAQENLGPICEKFALDACPLSVKTVAKGDPAKEILKYANNEDIDIIVLATKGAKGHFRFGSVSAKVVKNASVPVVTIPVKE
jgi:nucleotide-binding universal stress UspA family protein